MDKDGQGGKNIQGYDWKEDHSRLVVHFNNHQETGINEVQLIMPVFVKNYGGKNDKGTDKYKHKYVCPDNNNLSICRGYKLQNFKDAVIEVN